MSSNNRQNHAQQHAPKPPANFGSEQWMTDPFGLAPSATANSGLDSAGNGQNSSYREQTYTLPGGAMIYHEWSG